MLIVHILASASNIQNNSYAQFKKHLFQKEERNTSHFISRKVIPVYNITECILMVKRGVDLDYFNEMPRTF